MPWIYPAIIATVTLSIGTLLQRVLMNRDHSDPVAYSIMFQIILGVFSLLIAILFGKFVIPTDVSTYPRFIVAAIFWASSTVFGFQAMKRLTAGEVTIFGSAGTVVTMLLSVLFLHDHLSNKVLLGMGLILVAIFIVTSNKLSFKSRSGIIYSLLSAVCSSVALINDVIILRTYEAFSYMTIMSFLPALVLWLLYPQRIRQCKQLFKSKTILLLSIFCFIYSIQGITYYVAIENGAPLSQLSPLIKVSTVLTILLAAIFLKERSHLVKKSIAAVITTIGAILVG